MPDPHFAYCATLGMEMDRHALAELVEPLFRYHTGTFSKRCCICSVDPRPEAWPLESWPMGYFVFGGCGEYASTYVTVCLHCAERHGT